MNRVVVTGVGIVSSIGNRVEDVIAAFHSGRSGIRFAPELQALGFRCCVLAPVCPPDLPDISRAIRRRLSTAAAYALAAALQARDDAGLASEQLASPQAGVVFGTGLSGRCDLMVPDASRPKLDRPSVAARLLSSSPAGLLAEACNIAGPVVSLSAACATGLYNIGHAFELLRHGALEVCLTGSTEGEVWQIAGLSGDNSNGMPTDWNDRPAESCRPFDRDRQGFVMSAGAGALMLETLEHAQHRGARIYAEVVGYGAANDGQDMFNPAGVGLELSIEQALSTAEEEGVRRIDYINAHGTGTPNGDAVEAQLIARLFGDGPLVSSTKGHCGHAQGAAASQEAVFTVLMLHHQFVAPTRNLLHVAPECAGPRYVREPLNVPIETAMTLNSGLGGVNACLILRRWPSTDSVRQKEHP